MRTTAGATWVTVNVWLPMAIELTRDEGRDYEPADRLLARNHVEWRERWGAGTGAEPSVRARRAADPSPTLRLAVGEAIPRRQAGRFKE